MTNGSGSGRTKNILILRIRIRNTGLKLISANQLSVKAKPAFVNFLRSPGIDSQPGGFSKHLQIRTKVKKYHIKGQFSVREHIF
jgi:hypothetical protein